MLCRSGQVHSSYLLTAEPTLMGRSTCDPLESLKGMLMGWSSCTAPMPALRAGPCCCSCSPLEVGWGCGCQAFCCPAQSCNAALLGGAKPSPGGPCRTRLMGPPGAEAAGASPGGAATAS